MPERICSTEGCNRKHYGRGLCERCWGRAHYHGLLPPLTWTDRFWTRVEKTEACWFWRGTLQPNGYGSYTTARNHGRSGLVHRIAYELLVGPIPDGLTIDHLCRVRHCVNPRHMETVTNQANNLRGESVSAKHARVTHCPQGHPYDAANTYVDSVGSRHCRTCKRDRRASP